MNETNRTTCNRTQDQYLDPTNKPKKEDCPYIAVGDSLIIIPSEIYDDVNIQSNLLIVPGLGQSASVAMRGRLMKGEVLSVGEGVVGINGFLKPKRPEEGDIVYFEANHTKDLPGGFSLVKFEGILFIADKSNKEFMKKMENIDKEMSERYKEIQTSASVRPEAKVPSKIWTPKK